MLSISTASIKYYCNIKIAYTYMGGEGKSGGHTIGSVERGGPWGWLDH